MRVLVTGANGFVGGHLQTVLAERGDDVVAVSREDLDLRDAAVVSDLLREVRPGKVFHLAAQASVARSFSDPVGTFEINALGTLNLLEAVREHAPTSRVLVSSSADTYGCVPVDLLPVDEETRQQPASPYAASKVAQEVIALQYCRSFGMETVVTRSFNAIGPGQAVQFAMSSFASQLAAISRGEAEPVLRVGNLDVERDLIDVRDVVRAQVMLLDSEVVGEVFNICTGVAVRLRQALDLLVEVSGQKVEIEVAPERLRPVDVQTMVGDARKLCAAVPWSARIPLAQSLADLYDTFKLRGDRI